MCSGSRTLDTDRGFLGQIEDPTGLAYLNARYYDPDIGIFISPDPVVDPAQPASLNPYAYAHGNPTTLSDPSGLWIPIGGPSRRGYHHKWSPKTNQDNIVVAKKVYRANIMYRFGDGSGNYAAAQQRARAAFSLRRLAAANPDPGFWRALARADSAQGLVLGAMRAANPDPGFWKFMATAGSPSAAKKIANRVKQGQRGNRIAGGFSVGGRFFRAAAVSDDGCGWGWNGLRNCGENVLDGARFAHNIAPTTVGWLWAEAHGANCGFDDGIMIVCRGQDGGYARSGMTFGNVYMTGEDQVDDEKLRHESIHATHEAVLGPAPFLEVYGLDWLIAGGDPCRQVMERTAGLADGDYDC